MLLFNCQLCLARLRGRSSCSRTSPMQPGYLNKIMRDYKKFVSLCRIGGSQFENSKIWSVKPICILQLWSVKLPFNAFSRYFCSFLLYNSAPFFSILLLLSSLCTSESVESIQGEVVGFIPDILHPAYLSEHSSINV